MTWLKRTAVAAKMFASRMTKTKAPRSLAAAMCLCNAGKHPAKAESGDGGPKQQHGAAAIIRRQEVVKTHGQRSSPVLSPALEPGFSKAFTQPKQVTSL